MQSDFESNVDLANRAKKYLVIRNGAGIFCQVDGIGEGDILMQRK